MIAPTTTRPRFDLIARMAYANHQNDARRNGCGCALGETCPLGRQLTIAAGLVPK